MRVLRVTGWGLISAGVLILAFLAYQLWATTLLTARAQDQLSVEFEQRIVRVRADQPPASPPPPEPADEESPPPPSPPAQVILEDQPAPGEPLGRLLIPDANVDALVIQGVERSQLKQGPGHMEDTPVPGQPGNAVISGHRTTYGAPFYDLDLLEQGDQITIETTIGTHVFEVRESVVVEPTDVWVLEPRPGAWLTLTTCNPRFSASQRLVVFAELVGGPNQAAVAGTSS